MTTGYWSRDDAEEPDDGADAPPTARRTERVVPYVTDTRNALLIEPTTADPTATLPGSDDAEVAGTGPDVGTMASVQAALSKALQVVFRLESNEIAAEPLPSRDDRRLLLVYEADEGGAGVLKQLVSDAELWKRVAAEALKICHTDPETAREDDAHTGEDGACEAACYDCLMSYSNQLDHDLLDRDLAIEFLEPFVSAAHFLPDAHDEALAEGAESSLERQFLNFLQQGGYRRPDRSQEFFEDARTRPDFIYDEACAVVYVDGRPPRLAQARPARRRAVRGHERPRLPGDPLRPPRRLATGRCRASCGLRTRPAGSRQLMTFSPGALVTARGRDWVVLLHDSPELVVVRPLGGTDDETTGILTTVETVEPASFGPPDPARQLGDAHSARLLRDALRLGFRSGAGPFRSVARIACDPRPYQFVPLLMALRLDPVRLLIADDVGVGKTIEAALVASELMAQGDAQRLAVLCPPHLAEQWQAELRDKFHIDAELVLASTAARLERGLALGQSIFERHPHVIVSIDFIKSDRRRDDFIRACPELVIVDEAHTCARSDEQASSGRHQRHALVRDLAANPDRHLILVTATPHSGKDAAFRSLLGLLSPDFAELPEDLGGDANRRHRERLARHLVQRRRSEIQHYLGADTQFPQRAETEVGYTLSSDYRCCSTRCSRTPAAASSNTSAAAASSASADGRPWDCCGPWRRARQPRRRRCALVPSPRTRPTSATSTSAGAV